MQQRRGTAEQWTTLNPTLAAGEIGFETDTNKFKIGNGVDAWNNLVYPLDDEYVTQSELDPQLSAIMSDVASTYAPINSPTFSGLADFEGIVDFSDSIVVGIDLLPEQDSNAGKYLTTNGEDPSWQEIPAQTPHPFTMLGG